MIDLWAVALVLMLVVFFPILFAILREGALVLWDAWEEFFEWLRGFYRD